MRRVTWGIPSFFVYKEDGEMEKYISILLISFYIYGICGWIWESIVFPIISKHKIHNSGFLNGPVIPIYGVGALSVILLFEPNEKFYSLFLEGAVVACVIEYITSWGMEKIYHRRWWDYSHRPFHLNGRICLEGFAVFGLFSVVCVKWAQPHLFQYLNRYSTTLLIIVATAITTLFIVDFVLTIYHMAHIEERIEDFKKDVEMFIEDMENVSTREHFERLLENMKSIDEEQYQQLVKNKKYVEKRILSAFPHLLNKGRNKKS